MPCEDGSAHSSSSGRRMRPPRPRRCPPSSEPPPLAFATASRSSISPPVRPRGLGTSARVALARNSRCASPCWTSSRAASARRPRPRAGRTRAAAPLRRRRFRVLALRRLLLGGLPLPRRQLVDAVPRRQPLRRLARRRRAVAAAAGGGASGVSDAPSSSAMSRRTSRCRISLISERDVASHDAASVMPRRPSTHAKRMRYESFARGRGPCPLVLGLEDEREGDRRERPLRADDRHVQDRRAQLLERDERRSGCGEWTIQ